MTADDLILVFVLGVAGVSLATALLIYLHDATRSPALGWRPWRMLRHLLAMIHSILPHRSTLVGVLSGLLAMSVAWITSMVTLGLILDRCFPLASRATEAYQGFGDAMAIYLGMICGGVFMLVFSAILGIHCGGRVQRRWASVA